MDHDYKTFLEKIRDNCLNLERSRVPSLGFNAFALMSDIYHRENFHSDILCEILNPNGEHKEGKKFLQAFFDLLLDFCDEQNINDPQTEIKNIIGWLIVSTYPYMLYSSLIPGACLLTACCIRR